MVVKVPLALSNCNVLRRDDDDGGEEVVDFGLKLPSKYSFEFVDDDVNMFF